MGKQAKEGSYCHYISISSLAHYQIQNWIQNFSPYMQSPEDFKLSKTFHYHICYIIMLLEHSALRLHAGLCFKKLWTAPLQ